MCLWLAAAELKSYAHMQLVLIVAIIARDVATTMVMASKMILLNIFAPKSSIGSINGAAATMTSLGEENQPRPPLCVKALAQL